MAEKLIVVFFLLVGIIYTHDACSLSFGSFMAPKAGLLPVISGCTAIVLALVLMIRSLFQNDSKFNTNWRKLVFIVIGIFAYILLLNLVGYIPAVFIILLYLLKVTETGGWLFPCLFSAVTAISFYILFANFLGSNLP